MAWIQWIVTSFVFYPSFPPWPSISTLLAFLHLCPSLLPLRFQTWIHFSLSLCRIIPLPLTPHFNTHVRLVRPSPAFWFLYHADLSPSGFWIELPGWWAEGQCPGQLFLPGSRGQTLSTNQYMLQKVCEENTLSEKKPLAFCLLMLYCRKNKRQPHNEF